MQSGTGSMLVVRFDVESAYALQPAAAADEKRWADWIAESLEAVDVICNVLEDLEARASFFLVGKLLQKAAADYAALLRDNPRFDIGNHTYSHWQIWRPDAEQAMDRFREELSKTAAVIEKHFGIVTEGFTAPGCFYRGLRGKGAQLRVLWEEGYRYITTDGRAGPELQPQAPAEFTQPYWCAGDGFPEILELPLTGWHCNMLFNTGRQNDNWHPAPGFPDGTMLERLPRTVAEGFEVRRKELEYAADNRLIYAPAMHPWSLYRFDPELQHLRWLIETAMERDIPVVNCRDVYELYRSGTRCA